MNTQNTDVHQSDKNAHTDIHASVFLRLFRAIFTLSSITMLSRVFGLAREIVIASLFGANPIADAFATAFKLPNMFRQMFAEGALSASFIPVFTEIRDKRGEPASREFASALISIMILFIGAATLLAIIFMHPLIGLLNPPAESFDMIVTFTRIMSVYLLFMVLTALISGILNTKQHFAAGAFAPVLLNVFIIGGLIIAIYGVEVDDFGKGVIMSSCVAIAGLVQTAVVWLITVQKFKFVIYLPRPRLSPDIRQLFRLMTPGLISAGGLQVNTLVGLFLALRTNGGASQLAYAERLYMLPVGLIAVAFGVAALPQLSQFFANNQRDKAVDTINFGIELAWFIAVPAAFALIAMPDVIVTLLFQRGAFTADNTIVVSSLIAVFATALPALALQRVFNASFHARKQMRPPMLMTLAGVGVNIALALSLTPIIGLIAIPTALSLSAWLQTIALGIWVRQLDLWQPSWGTAWRVTAILLSSACMMGALLSAKKTMMIWVDDSTLKLFLITSALVVMGMILYFTSAILLRSISPNFRKMVK